MRSGKVWVLSLALLGFFLGAVSLAQAHKLLVSAVPGADGALKVESFFPDGSPAQEIPVAVIPEDGGPSLSAKTDNVGACSFAALPPGQYRVEVGDPLGHRAEAKVVIPGAAGVSAPSSNVAPPGAPGAGPRGAQVHQGEPLPWGNLLAGLGFIFGGTALIMVIRLRTEMRKHAPRD